MGPKKKNVRNDFYFFMQEQRDVLRAEGRKWSSPSELALLCGPRWDATPPEKRSVYKQMAKEHKEGRDRLDPSGRSLKDIQQELEQRERAQVDMRRHISQMLRNSDFVDRIFTLIHVNVMGETQQGEFLPCEIALAQYTLREGIETVGQVFVMPPKIPMGYAYIVEKRAQETHLLSPNSEPLEKKMASSYADIIGLIRGFLSNDRDGLVFTGEEDVDKVKQVLNNLFDWAGMEKKFDFSVYSIERLFFELTQLASLEGARLYVEADAKERLALDAYCYYQDIACPFHEANDRARFCSVYYVKKWCYIISDYCCPFLQIDLLPHRHLPTDSMDAQDYESLPPPILKRLDFTDYLNPGEEDETPAKPMQLVDAPPSNVEVVFVPYDEVKGRSQQTNTLYDDWSAETWSTAPTSYIQKSDGSDHLKGAKTKSKYNWSYKDPTPTFYHEEKSMTKQKQSSPKNDSEEFPTLYKSNSGRGKGESNRYQQPTYYDHNYATKASNQALNSGWGYETYQGYQAHHKVDNFPSLPPSRGSRGSRGRGTSRGRGRGGNQGFRDNDGLARGMSDLNIK